MDTIAGISEPVLRIAAAAAVFVVVAAAEALLPRRRLVMPWTRRWTTNLSIVAMGAVLVRVLAVASQFIAVPLVAVAAAILADRHGIGLLNLAAWPQWLEVTLAVIVLDFALWLQHLAAHKIPLLWRVHRMHHADRDLDVTSALRFHPIEIGLSMLYKCVWVFVLGASPLAVVLFEIILSGCAMFNHANLALPGWLDRVLRLGLVTPDMHRVHHSVHHHEHDSNYGFNLSVWDRLFATYTAQPQGGHDGMTIGLPPYQNDAPASLGWCLRLPFAAASPRDRSAAAQNQP
jgi:sterol desaturase/sphingolipid hydroxylase (fatty acid hydroxylase superfamily)